MQAAFREAGSSEQMIVETLRLVADEGSQFWMRALKGLTDPELGRALALATLGHGIADMAVLRSGGMEWSMSLMEAAALCVSVSSNTSIEHLDSEGIEVFGTVEGCALLGDALASRRCKTPVLGRGQQQQFG